MNVNFTIHKMKASFKYLQIMKNKWKNSKEQLNLMINEKKDLKNDSSLVPDIKSFHTLFNTYFKYLVEKGNSFNVSIFNERVGSNGYYINKDLELN